MSYLRQIGSNLVCLQCGLVLGWAEAPAEAESSEAEEQTETVSAEKDDWKIDVDRFLQPYLPRIEERGGEDEPIDDWVFELPELEVRAEFDDAREAKRLPDRGEIMSKEAKKRLLAHQRLTALETKVLNRWILWWGIRPEDFLLAREERERARAYKARNTQLLKQLEKIRPGLLDGTAE